MHPKRYSYENSIYEKWIRTKKYIICGTHPVDCHHVFHARNNSFLSVPLCRTHHTFGKDAYHTIEHSRFEDRHNIDLNWEIINLLSEFIQENK